MKICVLQPDYVTSGVDYQHYDPPRNLGALFPGHQVDHVLVNKLTTHRQLRELATQGYDIFINLCEGYLDWEIPSIDVIETLERLRLPYSGPTVALYDPSKALMKYVAYTVGVATPRHALAREATDLVQGAERLRFPLFVKPAHAGDSLGVDEGSLVRDAEALATRVEAIAATFGEALIEEYVDGPEFTVLVLAGVNAGDGARALQPIEYRFPPGAPFKTYAHKTSALHPEANVPVADPALAAALREAAVRIFEGFGGVGYARLDFRQAQDGTLHFLEINFACSVFYGDGLEGSADHILRHDGLGPAGFAAHIVAEGIARHRRRTPPYRMHGDAVSGYGIVATRPIVAGEVVHRGEGRPHRLVTLRHATAWPDASREAFRRYAWPLSDEVFVLWDSDPTAWAPQNHSCDPNCRLDGLDMVASRDIALGEELTLDYAEFIDDRGEAFACHCGSPRCRGTIAGRAGNSLTAREQRSRSGRHRSP